MNVRTILLATALASGLATAVTAQQTQGQMPMGGSSGQTAINLPEACRSTAQATAGQMIQNMQGQMSQNMQGMQGMMGQMTETQKGLHEAMMKMNGPMMTGMMNKDADVAWVCAMIPHHLGAVEMARAGLRGADNAESKRLAEKTIMENEKGAKELVAWVEQQAKRESQNEAAGSTTPRQ